MGTYPPHTRKTAQERRVLRLRRALRSVINPPDTEYPVPNTTNSIYWVGAGSTNWYDARNWSASSGGDGGYGVPTATNPVVFDGGSDTVGPFLCVLERAVTCAAISFTEAEATVATEFSQNGKTITCTTFTYNVPTANSGEVFDGPIYVTHNTGTFTVTAAENADHFGSDMTVYATGTGITVTSAVALAGTFNCAGNFTTGGALSLGRLIFSSAAAQAIEFLHGVDFTLIAYTEGDWDGASGAVNTIVSDDASTWGFVNPAGMVVAYINVQDSNATNAIDATDNCVDGTGNTNWTFV